MGHLGLLPQSTKGKFKSKGKTTKEINQLINDALLLQKMEFLQLSLSV